MMIQLRAIMVFTRSCTVLEEFLSTSFFFFLLSAAYRKQTQPAGLWRERIRGSLTQNLRVLPVFKLSAKPNKSLECLPKTNNRK